MTSDPFLLRLYGGASRLASPLAPFILRKRLARGKEDAARLPERLGHPGLRRPAGPLVWLHAASVGELVSLVPVADAVVARGINVLVTTGTVTSARIAVQRLPNGAIHQYAPIDTPGATGRFMKHWRPDLAIFVESELWPNLIRAAARSGARLALINGRISEKSHRGWQRAPSFIKALLERFSVVQAQTEEDAERLRALGAVNAVSVGNIKFDAPPLPVDDSELSALRAAIGKQPVFIAASTHPGEEEIIIAAHLKAAETLPRLITIVAPRHPDRGQPLAELARRSGLPFARRALAEPLMPDTSLYIADTVGEMGLVYRLGGLAFVGGSFAPRGGQNPIEPAKLGVAVIHGPDVSNFTAVYDAFDRDGGALEVRDPDALGETVAGLLGDPGHLASMQRRATATADGLSGAMAKALAALEPHLPATR